MREERELGRERERERERERDNRRGFRLWVFGSSTMGFDHGSLAMREERELGFEP